MNTFLKNLQYSIVQTDQTYSILLAETILSVVRKTKMLEQNQKKLKEREEKAEADFVIVTLKVTYNCASEGKLKKMKRNQRKTKRAASAEKNVMVAAKRREKMLKVKAKAQAAAAPKQTRQPVRQKVETL